MVCTGQIDSSGQTESSDEGGRRGGMSAYVSVLKSTKSYKIQQSQIQFHGELCFAGHQHPLNEGGEALSWTVPGQLSGPRAPAEG